ncbi:MAG: hypothetical protein ACLT33_12630 [Lachnospira pectinoschiza]
MIGMLLDVEADLREGGRCRDIMAGKDVVMSLPARAMDFSLKVFYTK